MVLDMIKLLRDRLTVGHIPLEDGILVRIQVPQQNYNICINVFTRFW